MADALAQWQSWRNSDSVLGTDADPDGPLNIINPADPTHVQLNPDPGLDQQISKVSFIAGATVRTGADGMCADVLAWMDDKGLAANTTGMPVKPSAQFMTNLRANLDQFVNGLNNAIDNRDVPRAVSFIVGIDLLMHKFGLVAGFRIDDVWRTLMGQATASSSPGIYYDVGWDDVGEDLVIPGGGWVNNTVIPAVQALYDEAGGEEEA